MTCLKLVKDGIFVVRDWKAIIGGVGFLILIPEASWTFPFWIRSEAVPL
jgi:hypothetical protein